MTKVRPFERRGSVLNVDQPSQREVSDDVDDSRSVRAVDRVWERILCPTIVQERCGFVGERLNRAFDSVPVAVTNGQNDPTVFFFGYLPAPYVIAFDRELARVRRFE